MTKKYLFILFFFGALSITIFSCSEDHDDNYQAISPVDVDLTTIPYTNLSEYHFFEGAIKNQNPSLDVLPYEPASSLFSDYAHKKRFVWMPKGTKATYNGDDNALDFPVGSALIKTFYYDNVQPNNTTKLIETRLLIKKINGWQAYTYVWNDDQTDAVLEATGDGLFVPITWNENGNIKNTDFKIPSQTECITCHKINPNQTGEITVPIGPKPQNLNTIFNYTSGNKNQIEKWIEVGYLENNIPANINSTVDWNDTTKSLELRAKSYIDINCAHCHRDGGHCDYTPQRFNFSNTDNYTFGICLTPLFTVPNMPFVINGGFADNSEMIFRMNSTDEAEMMPIIGRTIIHEEGVQLMKDWINSLPANCR
ncbi:MAG: hypothetical protein ABNG96_06945 [Flavobacterium sp.]|jgi:uncharacterized repeat protein (TIGR03806 family)